MALHIYIYIYIYIVLCFIKHLTDDIKSENERAARKLAHCLHTSLVVKFMNFSGEDFNLESFIQVLSIKVRSKIIENPINVCIVS